MRGGRHRLILVALAAVGLTVLAAGCSFESEIAVQLLQGAPVMVKQSTKVDVTPQRVRGTTTRAGQVVRIDCSITGIYDVDDPTGPAVLVQLFVVHLRTRPLPRGTPYQLDCAGPVIVELPTDASDIQAAATDGVAAAATRAGSGHVDRARVRKATAGRARDAVRPRGTAFTLSRRPHGRARLQPARGPQFREKVIYTARSRAAARNTCSRSARSSRRWRERGHSPSSRRRTRPASPSRTSLAASSPTAKRRERFRAFAEAQADVVASASRCSTAWRARSIAAGSWVATNCVLPRSR